MVLSGKKSYVPLVFMGILVIISLLFSKTPQIHSGSEYNYADVAWMLTSTALVLIMTPGLAYFYGGMVKKKECNFHNVAKFYLYGSCSCPMGCIWL
jgi:Amt family ammonium transporter